MAKNKGNNATKRAPAPAAPVEPSPLSWTSKGLQIRLHVKPNAKVDEVIGIQDNKIHVYVTSPPQDGEANRNVVEVISLVRWTHPSFDVFIHFVFYFIRNLG